MPLPPIASQDVAALARLLREAGLSEISVETTSPAEAASSEAPQPASTLRVMLRRVLSVAAMETRATQPAAASLGEAAMPAPLEAEPLDAGAPVATAATTVLSPAVGLFREAEAPFAEGDAVVKGQVLGVVESLKIPNEVRAPVAGTISGVAVGADQGVEYGQLLFSIVELAVGS